MDKAIGKRNGARDRVKTPTQPENGNIIPDDDFGSLPRLAENPSGVQPPGTLVRVREVDLAQLVIAARYVAFGDWPIEVAQDPKIRRLDRASEAFADTFPWDDTPAEDMKPLRVGETVKVGSTKDGEVDALVGEDRKLIVTFTNRLGGRSTIIMNDATIRQLAILERRIP